MQIPIKVAQFSKPINKPEARCGFSEVFDAVGDGKLAGYAPVLSGTCELGKFC
jgi:hypothetical protein